MQEAKEYHYEVFVSYRHRPNDEKWARWLQEAIETYETPPAVVQRGFSSQLGKAFVDDTEMAAQAELSRAIKAALWESRRLIVVCSPDTPQSDWVRQEINLFRNAWGRRERVLVLLIAGNPALSFPPELRELRTVGEGPDTMTEVVEPAGATVMESQDKTEAEVKALALDKFAAAILDCDLGELRNRREERIQRETSVRLFRHMVHRRGMPEGVGEVSPEHQRRVELTYRFDYRGGTVRRVDLVNGRGLLKETSDRVCRLDVSYRSDGTVEAIDHRSRHGNTRLREQFNRDASIVDFFDNDQSAAARPGFEGYMGLSSAAQGEQKRKKTQIVRHRVDYDGNGFVRRRRYARDAFNTPAQDALGSYGEWFERDQHGLEVVQGYLDINGEPLTLKNGVHRSIVSFDDKCRRKELRLVNRAGHPALGQELWASNIAEYDEVGNLIAVSAFGADEKPCLTEDGVCRITARHDERGNRIQRAFFGVDGQPCLHRDGYARVTACYDERGNQVEQAFFGVDGQPCLHRDGYARVAACYDERDDRIEGANFGVDGQSCMHREGFARVTTRYDERGNWIEEAYFGVDSQPCMHREGFARVAACYDERGNQIERAFFDVDGQPCLRRDGYARFTSRYDERGNDVELVYFGVDGQPCLRRDGYARAAGRYDERGNLIEVAYFGVDGQPCLHRDGYVRFTSRYDERGNQVEWAYFVVDGQPCLHRDGYARLTTRYDERGNEVEKACFGIDGQPCLSRDGYARFTACYDERGNRIEVAYFGPDGQPCLHRDGYARFTACYDERGNQVEQACFGVDGQPCLHSDGYARFTSHYDERCNMTEQRMFATDGSLIWRVETCFDDHDRLIEQMNCGPTEKPKIHADGYAGWRLEYDARGNRICATYLGADREPVKVNDGFASWRSKFNERDQEIEVHILDQYDRPTTRKDGYTSYHSEFDEQGNRIRTLNFGLDGNPIANAKGYAEVQTSWNHFHQRMGRSYFGLDGEPVDQVKGYHRVEFVRNIYGDCTVKLFFDKIGNAVAPPQDEDEKPDD